MKSWKRLVTAAVAVGLALVGTNIVSGASASAAGDCRPAIFETDGYGAGQSLVNFNSINSRFPADWQLIKVPYVDGVFPVKDPHPLEWAVQDGVNKELAAVRDFHARCPGSHITLMGYSEGAVVAGDVLQGLSDSHEIPSAQLNGVLYGDPRRPFYPSGIGGVAGGIETNLPTLLPGVVMHGPHHFGDIEVSEVCKENDGMCNSANLITNAQAFANGIQGYFRGDHGYDMDPWRDSRPGNNFIHQPVQQIQFGAPLPLPIPTPWQLEQADPTGYVKKIDAILYQIGELLNWGGIIDGGTKLASPAMRAFYQHVAA